MKKNSQITPLKYGPRLFFQTFILLLTLLWVSTNTFLKFQKKTLLFTFPQILNQPLNPNIGILYCLKACSSATCREYIQWVDKCVQPGSPIVVICVFRVQDLEVPGLSHCATHRVERFPRCKVLCQQSWNTCFPWLQNGNKDPKNREGYKKREVATFIKYSFWA